jgi:hypothetical protein
MSGSRQHELPRFLTNGFASRIVRKTNKDDSVFVWVYRRNTEPFESNTSNVGVGGKFYDDGVVSVDDEITDLEGRFANCLNQLRESHDGSPVTNSVFLDFVVHLTSRTKHLRDSIINTGGFLTDALLSYLSENWREYFGGYFAKIVK